MKKTLFLLLIWFHTPTLAQQMGRNEVVADLTFLIEGIKKYNPALPFYHPEFDSLSAQVITDLPTSDSLSLFAYYSAVSSLCALSNEGHLKVGNRNDVFTQGILTDRHALLPIQIKIMGGRLFIDGDYSDEQVLDEGDEILAINGMKTERILNELLTYTPSDGEILTYAYRKIEDRFPFLYLHHIQQSDGFDISFIDKTKKQKTVSIKALIWSAQVENFKKLYPDNNAEIPSQTDAFYTFDVNDDYALLTLPSFDFRRVNKYGVKSKKLYQSLFKELDEQAVRHLIIDLRDNTGGRNEFADDIIPFVLKTSNRSEWLKKTTSWEGKERTYKMPKVSKWVFKGAIYVLVNGKTFSAGSTLARHLKEYGNATIIGTETGTRYEGFAAGSSQDIKLPNSGLPISIPRYHIAYPKSAKQPTSNRGLLPDHPIEATYESYAKGIDLHINKVIDLINRE